MLAVNLNKATATKTKPAPHTPEGMATSATKTLNHGHRDGSQEGPPMNSNKPQSQWTRNAMRMLGEMQEDSNHFKRGIAQAKENLELLKTGLKELDERNTLVDEGIASLRLRVLEMEADLAQTKAIGFEGPRGSRVSEREAVVTLEMEAAASDVPVSELVCNDHSAEGQFQDLGKRWMAVKGEEAAEKRA